MVYALAAVLWIVVWIVGLKSATLSGLEPYQDAANVMLSHPKAFATSLDKDDAIAHEIPGMKLEIPFQDQPDIQIVYPAIERGYKNSAVSSKGLVLLLHACTHSALKFFSQSAETCSDCVGLSEELRMVRLLLKEGYTPVAITSLDRKSGCWSNGDIPRLKHVLKQDLLADYQNIYAMGASSGGAFVGQLLVQQDLQVQAGVVMVMGLGTQLVTKLQSIQKPIYLAPMPRDKGTTLRANQNYHVLKDHAILDTTSCKALPVTTSYLLQRVPGLTQELADKLILALQKANHIDENSSMLLVDPTRSKWRNIVSPQNATHYAGLFALKPGYSPLAKALHRAWAFHEYCSEVVVPALRFFEQPHRL